MGFEIHRQKFCALFFLSLGGVPAVAGVFLPSLFCTDIIWVHCHANARWRSQTMGVATVTYARPYDAEPSYAEYLRLLNDDLDFTPGVEVFLVDLVASDESLE
jgi:hypothetical protein